MKKIKLLTASLFCLCIQFTQAQDVNNELVKQARYCEVDEVKALVAKGAKINFADEDKVTPLLNAVSKGKDCKEVIDYLLAQPGINLKAIDAEGNNLFHSMESAEELEGYVSKFKAAGVNINALNKDGKTPLVCAILQKNEFMTKELILNGADINIKYEEQTPFEIAIDKDRDEVIEAFIYGKCTKEMLEIIFCNTINIETIKKAIAQGVDINARICGKEKDHIIFELIYENDENLMSEILKMGVDINIKDTDGSPLLFYTDNHKMIKFLINNKINMYATNEKGKTIMQRNIESFIDYNPKATLVMDIFLANGFIPTNIVPNKFVLKFIDEYVYVMPAYEKKTPENIAERTAASNKRKEELKAYFTSKGIK